MRTVLLAILVVLSMAACSDGELDKKKRAQEMEQARQEAERLAEGRAQELHDAKMEQLERELELDKARVKAELEALKTPKELRIEQLEKREKQLRAGLKEARSKKAAHAIRKQLEKVERELDGLTRRGFPGPKCDPQDPLCGL